MPLKWFWNKHRTTSVTSQADSRDRTEPYRRPTAAPAPPPPAKSTRHEHAADDRLDSAAGSSQHAAAAKQPPARAAPSNGTPYSAPSYPAGPQPQRRAQALPAPPSPTESTLPNRASPDAQPYVPSQNALLARQPPPRAAPPNGAPLCALASGKPLPADSGQFDPPPSQPPSSKPVAAAPHHTQPPSPAGRSPREPAVPALSKPSVNPPPAREDWRAWTRAALLSHFDRFPREAVERLIAEECPTGEWLPAITSEALRRVGFGTGHIAQIRKLFATHGIPNCDLNPAPGEPRRVSSGPVPAPPVHLAQQICALSRRLSCAEPRVREVPVVYAVPLTEVNANRARRLRIVNVGPVCQVDKPEKRILLVGGTGSGKTTWLNSVANYLYGVSWASPFRFKVVTRADEGGAGKIRPGQAFSQTQFVTSYKFEWQPDFPCDFSLIVIDTPGFGDTDGLDRDHEIEEQMHGLFEMRAVIGMDQVDAVVLVVPAASARLTANQSYICATIKKLFGPEIGENLVIATTFADFGDPPVIHSIQREGIAFRRYFKFNNSALFDSNDDQGADMRLSRAQWDSTLHNFDGLVKFLSELQPRTVMQRRASQAPLLVALHGHNHKISRKLVRIEKLRMQIGFITRCRPQVESQAIILGQWTRPLLGVLPMADNVLCVMCNASCDPSSGSCPGRCNPSFHVSVPFRTQYEEKVETYTTSQLVAACAEGGETKVDVGQILRRLNEKLEKTQRRVLFHVSRAKEVANQVCPELPLCSDSDYLWKLIAVEKAGRQMGYKCRAEHLETLTGLAAQEPPL